MKLDTPCGDSQQRQDQDGFAIHRQIFQESELRMLRSEVNRIASEAGTVCVRHLCLRSECMTKLARDPRLTTLLNSNMELVRAILFDKTADTNWPVAWHQDLTVALVEKRPVSGYGPWSVKDGVVHAQPPVDVLRSIQTIRIHLDPTSEANGALRVIPGSHLAGCMTQAAIKDTVTNNEEAVCSCAAGDVLVMSPLLIHSSHRSREPDHRRIIHFEYAQRSVLDPTLNWHESTNATIDGARSTP